MDDLLAAALEAAFKFILGVFFCIGIPVLIAYYAFVGLLWSLNELNQLWSVVAPYVVIGGGIAFGSLLVLSVIAAYWESWRIKARRRRALKRLDALYEQTAEKMDKIGGAQ
ncbi:hypothetical protein JHN55_25295 [Streptomyces sp. MBT56]|uniref:hypothetical protein n=1 Tax=unclassified Streptomyces TaxID=2593676 RepID=UPI00190B8D5D|nr:MULTISPECIES: hypothetical protein [unclassified Streptomyces]MBK3559781.1 hypothetical protein [Streptomyces sp. MBT56]MBK3601277.1 hypothetical protein [Streptomyces sp. MBT54]MBK3615276.1 hypothetical protein [Streptomyces sp. MBT98]